MDPQTTFVASSRLFKLHHSESHFPSWNTIIIQEAGQFGLAGRQLFEKQHYIVRPPGKHDIDEDGDFVYDHLQASSPTKEKDDITSDSASEPTKPQVLRSLFSGATSGFTTTLSSDGLKAFAEASKDAKSDRAKFDIQNMKLAQFLLTWLHPSTITVAQADPAFDQHLANGVGYDLYKLLVNTFSKGDASTILARTRELFLLDQGTDPFEAHIQRIRDGRANLIADWCPPNSLEINVDHLIGCILLSSIDQSFFHFPKESFLASHPDGKVSDLNNLIHTLQVYKTSHSGVSQSSRSGSSRGLISSSEYPYELITTLLRPTTTQRSSSSQTTLLVTSVRVQPVITYPAHLLTAHTASSISQTNSLVSPVASSSLTHGSYANSAPCVPRRIRPP